MNVLIIDDNVAIREALREALAESGHAAWVADTAEAAAKMALDPRFDVTIIDADAEGGMGMPVIDALEASQLQTSPKVLVIRSPEVPIPSDSIFVRGILDKPFSSSDVLDKIEDIRNTADDDEHTRRKPVKSHRPIFRRKEETARGGELSETGLEFGKSYVLFQENPKAAYSAAASFGASGYSILAVTSAKPKAMAEKLKGCNLETVTLEVKSKGEFSDVYRLGTLINQVTEFVSRVERPVVVMDNLNQLINRNGMNPVLMMLDELTAPSEKPFTLIASVDAHGFSDKDRSILKNLLNHYVPGNGGKER